MDSSKLVVFAITVIALSSFAFSILSHANYILYFDYHPMSASCGLWFHCFDHHCSTWGKAVFQKYRVAFVTLYLENSSIISNHEEKSYVKSTIDSNLIVINCKKNKDSKIHDSVKQLNVLGKKLLCESCEQFLNGNS